MRFARRPLTFAVLAAGLASGAAAEEYVKSYPVAGRPTVHIRADDGNVRVIPSDEPRVEFRVTYEGYTLGEDLHIESRQDGNRVELTERIPSNVRWGVTPRRISIELHTPRDADLTVETGDGTVEVSSLKGSIRVSSGDGSVRASQLSGNIELRTGDGDIRAQDLTGDLRLKTGDGRIDGSNLDGKCDAWSGDGGIRLMGRFDELRVRSGDGGVTAQAAAGSTIASDWSINTGDGAVELTLPKDLKADVDASTNDGRITLGMPVTVQGDFGDRKVRGAMNGGGPALRIRTGDGSIRINGA
jgi:DUF4097 and DUF4098 domain-containing protein YvlB